MTNKERIRKLEERYHRLLYRVTTLEDILQGIVNQDTFGGLHDALETARLKMEEER